MLLVREIFGNFKGHLPRYKESDLTNVVMPTWELPAGDWQLPIRQHRVPANFCLIYNDPPVTIPLFWRPVRWQANDWSNRIKGKESILPRAVRKLFIWRREVLNIRGCWTNQVAAVMVSFHISDAMDNSNAMHVFCYRLWRFSMNRRTHKYCFGWGIFIR